jgi:hypothetical protein
MNKIILIAEMMLLHKILIGKINTDLDKEILKILKDARKHKTCLKPFSKEVAKHPFKFRLVIRKGTVFLNRINN